VWPQFRAFCGDDVIVAHNGYEYDFWMHGDECAARSGETFDLCTYDTLPLARDLYRTSPPAHRTLPRSSASTAVRVIARKDDARTLAHKVFA
jgi:DNA polymerase III alpha subunit (gram-positive type)